jgi:tetratricopeptide (TPR) repeat protein
MDNSSLPVDPHPVQETLNPPDLLTEAIHYHQLGMVEQEQLRFDEAIALFQKALHIFERAGDFYNAASDYHQLGIIAQRQRRLDDAIALFQQACQIFTEANDPYRASYPWMGLAEIATERGNLEQASDYYGQAFDARSTAEDWPRASSTLNQWAQVLETQKQWAEAMHLYMQALSIDVEHNQHCFQLDIWDLGRMLGILGANEFEAIWLKVAGQVCPEKLYAKIRASKI